LYQLRHGLEEASSPRKAKYMSNSTLLIFATAPALPLLVLSVAWALGFARRGSAERTQLRLLRGLVWAFGAGATVYLGAELTLLVKSEFYGLNWTACLPMVIFGTAAAAAIWHIRNLKRQILARDHHALIKFIRTRPSLRQRRGDQANHTPS
jgi:hypothetical protein